MTTRKQYSKGYKLDAISLVLGQSADQCKHAGALD